MRLIYGGIYICNVIAPVVFLTLCGITFAVSTNIQNNHQGRQKDEKYEPHDGTDDYDGYFPRW